MSQPTLVFAPASAPAVSVPAWTPPRRSNPSTMTLRDGTRISFIGLAALHPAQ